MPTLVWRVKLVAELQPGVTTETEVARIERDADANLAELGLRLEEAKQLTAALQARIVPAQVTVLSECRRLCVACGSVLGSKGSVDLRDSLVFIVSLSLITGTFERSPAAMRNKSVRVPILAPAFPGEPPETSRSPSAMYI